MKKFRPVAPLFIAVTAALFLVGCSTSELVDVWSGNTTQFPPFRSVLVIAAGTNLSQRRIWEDAFCAEFAQHYTDAVPSYRSFPDARPDTAQVVQLVRTNGYDGVLIIRSLPPETDPTYVQGYRTGEQRMVYDRRRSRFITYYHGIDHYGYIDSQKVSLQSIDVWSVKDEGEMIWSAVSRTPEPSGGMQVRSEIAKLVMSELANRGIIASRR
jgi:uncharacterized protein YfiM (DUF2279 family)